MRIQSGLQASSDSAALLRAKRAAALHDVMPHIPSDVFEGIDKYIDAQWTVLRRSPGSLQSLQDTKAGSRPIIYCPGADAVPHLPHGVTCQPLTTAMLQPGLLYVPNDYVTSGGRFNEQYGWDSYFTVRGLLMDGHVQLARGMVDNLRYEIQYYGGRPLNANRSYYLGRSSPPFTSSAVLAVYRKTRDKAWLAAALPDLIKEYDSWMDAGPFGHLVANGLSRYASDIGEPCPEVEPGYYDNLPKTAEFYRHDRAERESGWDMTDRFGYRCMDFNPVDLASLQYKIERDLATSYRILEGRDSENARKWQDRASLRRQRINALMWDEGRGMFFDHNHVTGRRSNYECLATFYPLWAGLATKEQARRVRDNLALFEKDGGLATSTHFSGKQWDAPYGWPPLHMIVVEGLRRYGFHDDADRIEKKFLTTVAGGFVTERAIMEKYNVMNASAKVDVGYGNQPGFGWTNAAVRVFSADLLKRPLSASGGIKLLSRLRSHGSAHGGGLPARRWLVRAGTP